MSRRRGRPNRPNSQWSQETWQQGQKLKAQDTIRSRRALLARWLELGGTADSRSAEAEPQIHTRPGSSLAARLRASSAGPHPAHFLIPNLVFPLRGFCFYSAVQESRRGFPARSLRLNVLPAPLVAFRSTSQFSNFCGVSNHRFLRLARSGADRSARHGLPVAGGILLPPSSASSQSAESARYSPNQSPNK